MPRPDPVRPAHARRRGRSPHRTPGSTRTTRVPAAVAICSSTERPPRRPRASPPPRTASLPRAESVSPGMHSTRRSSPAANASRAFVQPGMGGQRRRAGGGRVGRRARSRRFPATTTSPGPSQVSRARAKPEPPRWWRAWPRASSRDWRRRGPPAHSDTVTAGVGPGCRPDAVHGCGGLGGAVRHCHSHLDRPLGRGRGPVEVARRVLCPGIPDRRDRWAR